MRTVLVVARAATPAVRASKVISRAEDDAASCGWRTYDTASAPTVLYASKPNNDSGRPKSCA